MNPVICGVDAWDSESGSAGTVHLARQLARGLQRPVLFVTVIDAGTDETSRESAGALVRHVAETSHDVDAAWTVEEGHPADQLVALAREREASFLVVGNHGARSSLVDSVSAEVSRRAPCPVVVVPPTVTQV